MTQIAKHSTWIFRLTVYSAVLLLSYLAVAAVSDVYVHDKALKFCNVFGEGDSVSSLAATAVQAEVMQPNEQLNIRRDTADNLIVEFSGLTPFDGYACSMMTKNDRVISKKFSDLP